MSAGDIKFLVFDVESVPDGRLIRKVRYSDNDISEEEAIDLYRKEILEQTDGKSDFIPPTFQYPVAISIGKVKNDYRLDDLVCLDEPEYRPRRMTELFWQGVEETYANSVLVTFNGRGFDIPLLELMAYRYGVPAKRHFTDRYAARNRFSDRHFDMHDWLANFGAVRMNGGLNLMAKVIGKPGKMGTTGSEVYDLFLKGEMQRINDYCMHDVLDTYFVFLRTRVLRGDLTIDREQNIVRETKKRLEESSKDVPAFREYLDNWGDWDPWP